MARKISIKHNLSDAEFEEVLEKALAGLKKQKESLPPDPFERTLVEEIGLLFNRYIDKMNAAIARVITEAQ